MSKTRGKSPYLPAEDALALAWLVAWTQVKHSSKPLVFRRLVVLDAWRAMAGQVNWDDHMVTTVNRMVRR
jgi:hypothetical protein